MLAYVRGVASGAPSRKTGIPLGAVSICSVETTGEMATLRVSERPSASVTVSEIS